VKVFGNRVELPEVPHARYTEQEVAGAVEQLKARIAELEGRLADTLR